MSSFRAIHNQLEKLQSALKITVNRLWVIKRDLSASQRRGHQENDFLPRRLRKLKQDEQLKFDRLLLQLNYVISTQLDSVFIMINTKDDIQAMMGIRKTIRYIRNAFSAELNLGPKLDRLIRALPAISNN